MHKVQKPNKVKKGKLKIFANRLIAKRQKKRLGTPKPSAKRLLNGKPKRANQIKEEKNQMIPSRVLVGLAPHKCIPARRFNKIKM